MHPLALNFGAFAIHWYGVMVALGFLAGLWTAGRRGAREGIASDKIVDVGPWLIVGTLIGARALYVASYWREQFAGQPFVEIFAIHHGGLVYYGGLIGAALAGVLYSRFKRVPLWKLADIIAPSIALGHAFGRIGCLFNGCCYGRVCHLPWAIQFPAKSLAFDGQVADGLLRPDASHSLPVHPTQIYESVLNLALYAALAWLYRRKKYDGQIFATYLISYALLRSFVEIFRGDYPPSKVLDGWITPAHLVSVGILTVGLILLAVLRRLVPTPKLEKGE